MKLSYVSGEVPLNEPLEVTYAVDSKDPPFFLFEESIEGQSSPIGPSEALSGSGTFTITPGIVSPHVIEAFAAGPIPGLPDGAAFAQGPTFTPVAPISLSSLQPQPTTQPSASVLLGSDSESAHVTTIPTASASAAGLNLSSAVAVSTLLSQSGSVTIAYEVFTTGTNTIIIEETAVPASSTDRNATVVGNALGDGSAPIHVDKAAFAGAGIGAAIVLAVVFATLIVRRRNIAILEAQFPKCRPNMERWSSVERCCLSGDSSVGVEDTNRGIGVDHRICNIQVGVFNIETHRSGTTKYRSEHRQFGH
ncbi:hypothetical protein FB45DRAFT_1057088 [Roridomyces roridus]|uniref:Uncharacterized protein n=1 Tax=Roridomyces roridus TaxID=1738132 RepID=A0AAD7C029_9AGAR|nr:hypothetical protein FB45DRAFT_1057088 [Roridomyces roridus]